MDDILTLIIVIGASALAVSLLVALNAFIGGWTETRFTDLEAASARIATDVLGFEASHRGVLDNARKTALVFETGEARLGLATCRGDIVTVRALRPGDIRQVAAQGPELVVTLDDYTFAEASLRLEDSQSATRWAGYVSDFAGLTDTETSHAQPA